MDMQKQTHHSSRELDVAKIYLYAKDRNKVKHQILVNKQKNSGLKCVLIILKLLLNIKRI